MRPTAIQETSVKNMKLKQIWKRTAPARHFAGGFLWTALLLAITVCGIVLVGNSISTSRSMEQCRERYAVVDASITQFDAAADAHFRYVAVLEEPEGVLGSHTIYAMTSNATLHIGDTLQVYYDPEEPEDRVIDFQTDKLFRLVGILCLVFAGVCLLVTIGLLLRRQRNRKKIHEFPIS